MGLLILAAETGQWHGHWWGGVVLLLLFGFLLTLLAVKLFWFRPWRWRDGGWERPEEILRRRLASGQISEDEYRHLKQVLGG